MEYRYLGNSGLQVSIVGIGCNNFGWRIPYEEAEPVVKRALELGVIFFDTADVYGAGLSEEFLGRALGDRRDQTIIATKFGFPMHEGPYGSGASRRYIVSACEASLRRLGTDYIDLYQIHRPDVNTPIEETARALDDLVRAGKARYIGHSQMTGWQTAELHYLNQLRGYVPFISAQNEYSLLARGIEKELVPACAKFGVGILPFFPLAGGVLTGKYRRDEPPPPDARFGRPNAGGNAARMLSGPTFDIVEKLTAFAEARGNTLLELAVSWLLCRPQVATVIAGATKPGQVEANAAAAAAMKLSAGDLAEIDAITG